MASLVPRLIQEVSDGPQFLGSFLQLGDLFAKHFELRLLAPEGVSNLFHGSTSSVLTHCKPGLREGSTLEGVVGG
jgi:hypothetical protein